MADLEGLVQRLRGLVPAVMELVLEGKRILVVTHIDADGLCSGSVLFASLMRKGANVTLRTVPDLDPETVAELASQGYDFYIFVDLASTLVPELEGALGGRYLVIDHHEISQADLANRGVVNAWGFGYDGGREACSSAMAFFFALALDPANGDLAPLAVVGGLADRQDSGPGRSLTGLNRAAVEAAQRRGLLAVSNDLILTGRETRPVHESVALTSTPFLKGLTGSKDAALALLHQSGLELKDGGAWRTISSLTQDEKMRLTEVIAGALGAEKGATEALASLFGEVYTFRFEDPFTPLRDAREYGTLLNSCGRMGVPSLGISVCLGDRSAALADAMHTLLEYRSGINKALVTVTSDPARIEDHGPLVIIRGEGVVDERLLGPVVSILTSSPPYREKVVVGRATSRGGDLKISSRVGDSFPGSVNLGVIMREAAAEVAGVGGAHAMAAGAKIPSSRAETFSRAVAAKVGA
jgi:single-stranded-DNA-specific exonuclease